VRRCPSFPAPRSACCERGVLSVVLLHQAQLGDPGSGDGEGDEIDEHRLRMYERSKLRYYYAVAECDSVATAVALYEECDGLELQRSACHLDLRFVPDDQARQIDGQAGQSASRQKCGRAGAMHDASQQRLSLRPDARVPWHATPCAAARGVAMCGMSRRGLALSRTLEGVSCATARLRCRRTTRRPTSRRARCSTRA
jgi:hypothetical protein